MGKLANTRAKAAQRTLEKIMRYEYSERCGCCKNDIKHTKREHDALVKKAISDEAKREEALYRQAKKVYDNP